jgi:hypothetical protein
LANTDTSVGPLLWRLSTLHLGYVLAGYSVVALTPVALVCGASYLGAGNDTRNNTDRP